MKTAIHRGVFVTAAGMMLAACGSGSSISSSKPIGSAGGPCTSGGGCDPGLVCQSQVCTSQSDSGTGSLPDSGSVQSTNCSTSDLGGLGIPSGTVASASGNSAQSLASNAIDGVLTTPWNSGTYSGWLRLDFPAPVAMTGIRIAAAATPTASETYTITADGSSTPIGSATRQVTSGVLVVKLDAIPVTPGTYSSITVTVKGGLSWVQIQEISLVTSDCPVGSVGPGDAGNCDCSTRMCGDDGCGHSCGTCDPGETCVAGDCLS